MTANAADFSELLRRVKSGDAAALDELARTYEGDLRIAARVHLGPALRPYLDSIDLVQSVHRSLLRGLRDDRLELKNSAALIALALTMVRRKVARQWRRHRRQQRLDGTFNHTEQPADVLATLCCQTNDSTQSVTVRDAMERICRDLDPTDRQLLQLRLEGWTTAEVAEKLGATPEAMRIRLFRLRNRFAENKVASEWL